MEFFFIAWKKTEWACFQESQSEYSMPAFNYGLGAINTWALLCSVFHGWLLRKYNSQKLAIYNVFSLLLVSVKGLTYNCLGL